MMGPTFLKARLPSIGFWGSSYHPSKSNLIPNRSKLLVIWHVKLTLWTHQPIKNSPSHPKPGISKPLLLIFNPSEECTPLNLNHFWGMTGPWPQNSFTDCTSRLIIDAVSKYNHNLMSTLCACILNILYCVKIAGGEIKAVDAQWASHRFHRFHILVRMFFLNSPQNSDHSRVGKGSLDAQ